MLSDRRSSERKRVDYDTNNMTLRDILDNTTPGKGESISAIYRMDRYLFIVTRDGMFHDDVTDTIITRDIALNDNVMDINNTTDTTQWITITNLHNALDNNNKVDYCHTDLNHNKTNTSRKHRENYKTYETRVREKPQNVMKTPRCVDIGTYAVTSS
jgi:hypothetical protein